MESLKRFIYEIRLKFIIRRVKRRIKMNRFIAFIAAILCAILFVGCGKQNLNNALIAELPKIDDFSGPIIDYLDFSFEESVS